MNTCVICREVFKPKERGKKGLKQKTCSIKCRSVYQSGKNNPFYGKTHSEETKQAMSIGWEKAIANGHKPHNYGKRTPVKKPTTRRDSGDWRYLRKAILIRDKYICQLCKNSGNHVHHIIPYKDVKIHNADNLITLCATCHRLTFSREYEFVLLFQSILKGE